MKNILDKCAVLLKFPKLLFSLALTLHLLPFLTRPAIIGGDEPHYSLMAHSIAFDFDFNMDNNYQDVESNKSKIAGKKWAGEKLDKHYVVREGKPFFYHPLGLPLTLSPFIKLKEIFAKHGSPDLILILLSLTVTALGLIAGYQLLSEYSGNSKTALVVTTTLYFSSALWFYSRTVFTEPYIWSFSLITIWLSRNNRFLSAGIIAGLMFWFKEPSLITICCIGLGILFYYGIKPALQFSFTLGLLIILFVLKNYIIFGQLFTTFQPYVMGDVTKGIYGTLLDPSHGILIFCPLIILSIISWLSPPHIKGISYLCLLAITANFLLVAFWRDWGGGSCYGPRLLIPIIPFFAVPLVDASKAWGYRLPFKITFTLLTALGFLIQWKAAMRPFKAFWSAPVNAIVFSEPATLIPGILILFVGFSLCHAFLEQDKRSS